MTASKDAPPAAAAVDLVVSLGGKTILRGATLEVPRGAITALVGPNGAGKTTLIRALCGLIGADAGERRLFGEPLDEYEPRRRGRTVAMVPQDTAVDAAFVVADFVALGRYPHLGRFRPPSEADRQIVEEAMRAAEVSALRKRLMPTLSGGERQRVFLARAWATRAPLVVFDEPIANLDARHALNFFRLLQRLVAEDRAALITVHELNAALRFADRVAVLSQGRVVAAGEPAETLDDDCLAEVFGVEALRVTTPEGGTHLHLRLPPDQT